MREAKRLYYNKLIASAENRIKTTWRIINMEIGHKNNNNKDSLPKSFKLNTKKVNTREAAQTPNLLTNGYRG
jgi:hypothetical protein